MGTYEEYGRQADARIAQLEGQLAAALDPEPAPEPTPDPTSPVSAGTWLSGPCDDNTANTLPFGIWRGEPSTYVRCWGIKDAGNQEQLYMFQAYAKMGFTGTVDVACGGPLGMDWAAAASGGMDASWRRTCQTILAHWGKAREIHLSMAHELNGDWYPWSITPGNVAAFKTAWQRWHRIVQEELIAKGKRVKVVQSFNMDSKTVPVEQMYVGNAYCDIIGVDFYDMWMPGTSDGFHIRSLTDWNNVLHAMQGTSPRGIGAWQRFAKGKGKPLTVPEWGLAANTKPLDNHYFISKMRDFFAGIAPADINNPGPGELAGEAYFNTWDQCRLWPSTSKPQSAERYRSLSWGK